MVEMNRLVQKRVEAKTLSIYCKVRDQFAADLLDTEGQQIHRQEDGYVPGFMPGEHYGDYIALNIDIDTGQITNWSVPTAEELEEYCSGGEDG